MAAPVDPSINVKQFPFSHYPHGLKDKPHPPGSLNEGARKELSTAVVVDCVKPSIPSSICNDSRRGKPPTLQSTAAAAQVRRPAEISGLSGSVCQPLGPRSCRFYCVSSVYDRAREIAKKPCEYGPGRPTKTKEYLHGFVRTPQRHIL